MYKCFIGKVDKITKIPDARTVQVAEIMGTSCIVSQDVKEGDIGILFPAEGQLSPDYCRHNNLYRHSNLNKDNTKTGYVEDNGRINAVKFMKLYRSEGLFMPLESLSYLTNTYLNMTVGTVMNELGGTWIARKWENEATAKVRVAGEKKGKPKKTEDKVQFFEKHVDTDQFDFYGHQIPVGAIVQIDEKYHGTSNRAGYLPVKRAGFLGKLRSAWNTFRGISNYVYVVGSRNVTMYKPREGFHGSEQFRFDILESLKGKLSEGMTVYGEVVGYVNGKLIMPAHSTEAMKDKKFSKRWGDSVKYTYGCQEGEYKFLVYRITMTGNSGDVVEYSRRQMEKWCRESNVGIVETLTGPFVVTGKEDLKKLVETLAEGNEFGEDPLFPGQIREGVVVRVEMPNGEVVFYKKKSFPFKVCEGITKLFEIDYEDAS